MHARRLIMALSIIMLITACAVWALWATSQGTPLTLPKAETPPQSIPLAILGDSDSHSYQDTVSFPEGGADRGGRYRAQTWQWGELLSRLRGDQLDLGLWRTWGTRRVIAKAQDALGWQGRFPRKMDYRHNMAVSGAVCRDLSEGRMVKQLIDLMNENPQRWQKGIVVIRIGVNDVGTRQALTAWAQNGRDPKLMGRVQECIDQYKHAVTSIWQAHPQVRFVLVGLFDNSNWAPLIDNWQDPVDLQNIATGLNAFNAPLKSFAEQDKRLSFFDDQAWFRQHWGGRHSDGSPHFGLAHIDGRWPTHNTSGDSPNHANVQDGHAGTIWNLLWTQALVRHINTAFATGVSDIRDQDLAHYLSSNGISSW
ncbi:MAG: SGNH/GDSL hydrolase family protein [Aquabacterium sp.]|nr:SGNH/GDSL hydrolase family protein [Aquabacterium sp.]